jgi:putative lipoprotein
MKMARIGVLSLALAFGWGIVGQAAGQDRERDRDRDRDDILAPGSPDREEDQWSAQPRIVPPRPGRPDYGARWQLGVEVDYRDHGAQVTQVVRRSAASRAGLEPRDVIVTVNGYQVGYVNGRLYSLERELDLRADRSGRVRLLVQDRRNGSLANLDVRLDPADRPRDPTRVRPLTGTVTSQRLTRVPQPAVLSVRLVDLTPDRASQTVVAERSYRNLGPFPLVFDLEYDPDRIVSGREYGLEAVITVGSAPILRTREPYGVRMDGRPSRIQLEVEPPRGPR